MPSKMVTDRRKYSTAIEASIEINADDVVAGLEENFAGMLDAGKPMPDFRGVLELCRLGLAASRRALADIDRRHTEELAGDLELRLLRDRLTARLAGTIAQIRDAFKGLYGTPVGLAVAGVDGRTAPTDLTLREARNGEKLASSG